MHFLLLYREFVPDYVTRREPLRAAHLAHAQAAADRGDLLLAGALADPVDGAALLFQGDTADAAEHFARTDPYVLGGLVGTWEVRRWHTVIGAGVAHQP